MFGTTERYDRLDYSGPFVSKGLRIAAWLHYSLSQSNHDAKKILVLGAGAGYEVVFLNKCGHDVTAIDLSVPDVPMVKDLTLIQSAAEILFEDKSFDWVLSCEMIEHIPYDESIEVIKEAKRVAKRFLFTIADGDDPPFHTHINIHPGEFWISTFRELGFKIEHAQIAASYILKIGKNLIPIKDKNGVLILGKC